MIINKRKYKPACTDFKCNGGIINNGVHISNRFNDFFVNVGTTLANDIPTSTRSPADYIKQDIVEKMYLSPVTEDEI